MEEEIIIGKNPVIEALQTGRSINKVIISDQLNKKAERDLQVATKKANTILQKVPKQRLDQLSKGKHQGIIAYVSAYHYASVQEILNRAEQKEETPFIIILDEIEDPHNLGAILRTGDATGVHGVIIPKRRAVGLTETVAKASAGAMEHIPVARVTNIVDTIEKLKEKNIWVVGTDEKGTKDYRTLDGETPIALVIGNEGKGISRLVKDKCDWTIHLPMKGFIPSLNASVATGLLMYEIYRKRYPLGE
ncbi:23S rRNA (guanosine(2251)-2'-O)-methyltransferase RlmB [Pseudogracilibacillus auburnensis]|uniref:23S rRNA (Guanosine2251-2'-O)-methyltransferase n=1 Tax=Pseudogracilibacillus auburnensis TaxID=1494959 RepID=A0A2V3VVR8_9BACI|nr:23S rRNA (guanosine(2251)-2'-O)-methyltransferase RlmB [Pseudogracilibacillus auburnensis]MBO1005162.1 23S rRNA (guanosine(2251)-2'-O)-methyltransferase RlmB [Pseudogracilibacillus auburnensis]PXW84901.1 23S rRNA (guanosine2251-2'-O)-methyltransferase [Pseudogracilibacillus auburnensis]